MDAGWPQGLVLHAHGLRHADLELQRGATHLQAAAGGARGVVAQRLLAALVARHAVDLVIHTLARGGVVAVNKQLPARQRLQSDMQPEKHEQGESRSSQGTAPCRGPISKRIPAEHMQAWVRHPRAGVRATTKLVWAWM